MQLFAGISDARCQYLFYKHVYILAGGIKCEFTAFQISKNSVKTADNCIGFILPYDPFSGKHGSMRHASFYILPEHPAVKAY